MKTFSLSTAIFLFLGTTDTLVAQVIPTNHTMKNLKLGNIFFYHYEAIDTRGGTSGANNYFYNKVVRYDTIANKIYAVFQNGVRERADSSGVYWIPLSYDSTKLFTKEYLRYPLFTFNADSARLLFCSSVNFMSSNCFPEGDSFYRLIKPNVYLYPDTNYYVLGIKIRNFLVRGTLLGQTDCATILGPWKHTESTANYRYLTTLCGALIEGKYYGDSACLVASS
ncbi:MAG: hypothetical protein H9535_08070, partial [Ignavibacteria bacterium]|nr:hypothetical protein [Ignavibacteria bacterium]